MRQRNHRAVERAVRACVEQLESRRLLAAVGPDGWGYVADAHPFENIHLQSGAPGVNTLFEHTDDASVPIDLGSNTFNFYGATYTGESSVFVSSNGLIAFGAEDSDTSGDLINAPLTPAIAVLWQDWLGDFHGDDHLLAKFEDTGGTSAPDRLILQWHAFRFPGSAKEITFQAILQLNTGNAAGDITFNYDSLDLGEGDVGSDNATVGIKDVLDPPLLVSGTEIGHDLIASKKAILISSESSAAGHPHADAGGPYTIESATTDHISLDGSGSSDPDQAANTLTYAWDLDGDRIFGETGENAPNGDETGIHPVFKAQSYGDFTAMLRVIDSDHLSSYARATITVTPIKPVGKLTVPATGAVGILSTINYSATPIDIYHNYAIDWGDGGSDWYSADGNGGVGSHTYYEQGSYTITLTVSDDSALTGDPVRKQITIGPRPPEILLDDGTLLVFTNAGNDTITLDLSGSNARLNRNGTVTTYAASDVLAISIETGDGNDVITSSLDIPVTVNAGEGNDRITTGSQSDWIDAGGGDDTIDSGGGGDYVQGGDGDNHADLGLGSDTFDSAAGNNVVTSGDDGEYDSITTGRGDNRINIFHGTATTADGDDTIIGGDGGVTVYSGDGNDSVTTGAGDDYISESSGDDTISTGAGADTLFCYAVSDTGQGAVLDSGDGNDSISYAGLTRTLDTGAGDDVIAINRCQTVNAGSGDDLVHAGSDADHPVVVYGGDGDDRIFTGDGPDSIYGGAGADRVHAGNGSDLVSGGGGNDHLFGQGGNDRIYGGNGHDRLEGLGGDDRIFGGAGGDSMAGGEGNDSAHKDDTLDVLSEIEADLV